MNKRFLAFAAAVIMALCAVLPAAAQEDEARTRQLLEDWLSNLPLKR